MRHAGPASRSLALLLAASLTSGCVAAVVPLAAGAAMGRKAAGGRDKPAKAPERTQLAQALPGNTPIQVLPQGSVLPPPTGAHAAGGGVTADIGGGGEFSAVRMQTLLALENYLELRVRYLREKSGVRSAILQPGSTAEAPKLDTCGTRPLAVLFDVGGIADAYVAATALRVRDQEVAILFETADMAADPLALATAINRLGMGAVIDKDMLWLPQEGDAGNDARRARIAARWCVVALIGSRVAGFSDLLARDPRAANSPAIASLWGAGWFVLPAADSTRPR